MNSDSQDPVLYLKVVKSVRTFSGVSGIRNRFEPKAGANITLDGFVAYSRKKYVHCK